MLYTIFVEPLLQLYGAIYQALPAFLGEGGRIILFALFLNVLLMPFYAQMERKSRSANALRERVAVEVERMKKNFRGRELYYYIRAVHRQFNYRPLSQVFGSADLFVQVIVFATVYLFLSNLTSLQGTAFLSLRDLGSADGLLFGANLLPLLMTAINAATVYLYVRNRTRRLQAWCLAILFLVLLYDSPSGLVLYWTINNLVSFTRAYLQGKLAWNPPDNWQDNLAILRRQE